MKLTTVSSLAIGAGMILLVAPPSGASNLSMCRRLARGNYRVERLQCVSLAKAGQNGTTLAAVKTLDLCVNQDGSCTYSGDIGVSNTGAIATVGCTVNDYIECKDASGPNFTVLGQPVVNGTCDPTNSLGLGGEIPPNTAAPGATTHYSFTGSCCSTTARNRAKITITNHSGNLNTPFGPEPKATWFGDVPPCPVTCGCTRTRGYWQTHDGDPNPNAWGSPITPSTPWLNTAFGATWGDVLGTGSGSGVYYTIAAQYIAAVLNQQNGACAPTSSPSDIFGAGGIIDQLTAWLTTPTCSTPSTCGTQLAQKTILDDYNNGVYPGAPHCAD